MAEQAARAGGGAGPGHIADGRPIARYSPRYKSTAVRCVFNVPSRTIRVIISCVRRLGRAVRRHRFKRLEEEQEFAVAPY